MKKIVKGLGLLIAISGVSYGVYKGLMKSKSRRLVEENSKSVED